MSEAVELDARMTLLRTQQPFTHCYQCSHSQYQLVFHRVDDIIESKRVFHCDCKKGVRPEDPVHLCPYAKRYTNADALSADTLQQLDKARKKTLKTDER